MKNVLLVIAIVAALVLGVFAFRQTREIDRLLDEVGRLQAEHAQQHAAPAVSVPVVVEKTSVPARPAPAGPSDDDLAAYAAAPVRPSDATTATKPAAPNETGIGALMKGLSAMMTNDAMKSMIREQSKMHLDMRYGRLFQYLNLPPEKIEALKNLLMDRQMSFMDDGFTFMDKSLTAEQRKQKAKELEQKKSNYDRQLKELLGADDYDAFEQYEQSEPERMQVDMLKRQLASSAEPLTEKQEYDLVNAMHAARTNAASPMLSDSTRIPDPEQMSEKGINEAMRQMNAVDSQYMASASTILSPGQLEQFKKFNDQQRQMRDMGMRFAAQMFGGSNATPAVQVQSISVTPSP